MQIYARDHVEVHPQKKNKTKQNKTQQKTRTTEHYGYKR